MSYEGPNTRSRVREGPELTSLRIQNAALECQIEVLENQNQGLQNELFRINHWAAHYQAESEQKTKEINELKEQLARAEREREDGGADGGNEHCQVETAQTDTSH
ncbi:hypothetical protein BST61_g6748 [Cercospora zeina]